MRDVFGRRGLTIVELMIVLAVVLVLTATAISSYSSMRQKAKRGVCISNLRQIDNAIERWGLLADVEEGSDLTPYEDDIYAFIFNQRPSCPSGGTYTLTKLGQHPQVRCNIPEHELP